jgi:hypothetical protein
MSKHQEVVRVLGRAVCESSAEEVEAFGEFLEAVEIAARKRERRYLAFGAALGLLSLFVVAFGFIGTNGPIVILGTLLIVALVVFERRAGNSELL